MSSIVVSALVVCFMTGTALTKADFNIEKTANQVQVDVSSEMNSQDNYSLTE